MTIANKTQKNWRESHNNNNYNNNNNNNNNNNINNSSKDNDDNEINNDSDDRDDRRTDKVIDRVVNNDSSISLTSVSLEIGRSTALPWALVKVSDK